MVKHTQTICRLLPTNCFSVSDHFVGLALKGLRASQTFLEVSWRPWKVVKLFSQKILITDFWQDPEYTPEFIV